MPRPVRSLATLIVGLLALSVLSVGRESVAADVKVDLTDYLDGAPDVGDFRFYARSDGGSQQLTVEDRVDVRKTTTVTFAVTEDGATHHEIEAIVHGRQVMVGSQWDDAGLVFAIPHPKRVESFRFVPGKPQKFRFSAAVFYQGTRVATATIAGSKTFVGFESVTTPLGRFDQVAHFTTTQTQTIKPRKKGSLPVFTSVSTTDSWVSRERGTVLFHRESTSYQDGVFDSAFGPYDYTLDHGVSHGVAFP